MTGVATDSHDAAFRAVCRLDNCGFTETAETKSAAVDGGLEHNRQTGHLAVVRGGETDE